MRNKTGIGVKSGTSDKIKISYTIVRGDSD
jgi:hypothetical protein